MSDAASMDVSLEQSIGKQEHRHWLALARQPADLLGLGGGGARLRRADAGQRRLRDAAEPVQRHAQLRLRRDHRHRHDGGHHHRRHRPVGRRGAGAVGHGHRHDDERRHVDLAGGAAGARRGAGGRRVQRRADRLCRRAALRRHAGHAVDRAQPGDGAVEQPHGLLSSAPTSRSCWRSAAASSTCRCPSSTRSRCPARCSSCS